MMSNKGLNSNDAPEESTAINPSVTWSGIRRAKEAPDGLDIVAFALPRIEFEFHGTLLAHFRQGID